MKRVLLLLTFLVASAFTAPAQQLFQITNQSFPNAIVGQNYPIITLLESGSSAGVVTWSISAGALPSGFIVGPAAIGQPATNGTFCVGVPTNGPPNCSNPVVQSAPGSYTFTIKAVDTKQNVATKQFTIVIGTPVTITTQTLPNAFSGQSYSFQLQASGGTGPLAWTVFNSSLRQDFSLDQSTGTLGSGSVGAPGSFSFTVVASDLGTNSSDTKQLSLTVTLPLLIQQTTIPPALQGVSYNVTLNGSGGAPPLQWSLGANTTGLTIQGSGGGNSVTLSGFPQNLGNLSLPVTLTDSSGASVQRVFTLQVVAQLIITSQPPPQGEAGFVYSQQLTAIGGVLPYSWTITSGNLPPGLQLDSATGLIHGTPSTLGSSRFTVKLSDAEVPSQTATPTFTIEIVPGLVVSTTTLAFANTGAVYSQPLATTGGVAPVTWSLFGGTLPDGISLTPAGVLTGMPTTLGPVVITVAATDTLGNTARRALTLTVLGGTGGLSIFGPTSFNATVGSPFLPAQTYVASGGTPTFTWSISPLTVLPLAVPPGLSINATTGRLVGTPTTAGQFSFVVQLNDAEGLTATALISVNVVTGITILTTTLHDAVQNQPYAVTLVATGGVAPLFWSLASGTLPGNLTLNSSTGAISGTVVASTPSTFTIKVTDNLGASAQQTLTIKVVALLTTNSTSFTGTTGAAFSQTLVANGGSTPYTWSLFSGTLPAGLQLNNTTGVIAGTPTAVGTSVVTVQVSDVNLQSASAQITITIASTQTPLVTIGLGATSQPAVSVTLSSPAPQGINGTLTLTFASSVGGSDAMVGFTDGSKALNFVIASGGTQATFPTLPGASVIKGTVAGTITLTVTALNGNDGSNLLPNTPLTKTIVTSPAVAVITGVTLQQITGGINVVVTGFSNTREVSSGLFHFTVSSGNALSQADITVPLTSAYLTWFTNPLSNRTGGEFVLTLPFSVTQGTATAVTGVQVTLTNGQGPSAAVSSP